MGKSAKMDLAQQILATELEIKRRDGETLYRWGDTLAVIVLDTGEIGQFSSKLLVKRDDVVKAIAVVAALK